MPRTHLLVALVTLVCMVTRVSNARADAAVVISIGKASTQDRTTVASAVRSAARSSGWELIEAPLSEPEIATVLGCLKASQRWVCLTPLTSAKGIQRLIIVSVDPDEKGALTLTERILLSGSDVATSDQRPCPKCTAETLTRITFDLTKRLLEEASAVTGRTRLRIVSTPPGAWITLDNQSGGATDQTYSTFPGHHVVILQRDGYQTETRSVDVAENQEAIVAVTLRPNGVVSKPGATTAPVTSTDHPALVPAIVGGTGVGALVVGIGLQVTKKSPPVGEDHSPYLISIPGVALIAGGSLAIGVGVYLWTQARPTAAPASAPTVVITTGGGIVGWTGRF